MANYIETRASSINRALDQIGDKWSLLCIGDVLWGINTFNELLEATGMSRGVLSDRLKWLESVECLQKRFANGNLRRPTYHMTRKSVDLYETALTALNWERRYFSEPYMDAILLLHEDCGEILKPDMVCRHCGVEVRGEDVEYREGPGAGTDRRAIKVRRRSTKSIKDSVSARPSYKNLIHVIGDRWTANLIGLAFHGIKRFDDFHTALPIATNVLAGRLKFLLAEDIFTTEPYSTKPLRFDYILTERGRDLFPFFLALLQWGDRWCGDGSGPPTIPMHKPCGHRLRGKVRCSACERQALAHRVRLRTPDASNRSRIRARER